MGPDLITGNIACVVINSHGLASGPACRTVICQRVTAIGTAERAANSSPRRAETWGSGDLFVRGDRKHVRGCELRQKNGWCLRSGLAVQIARSTKL